MRNSRSYRRFAAVLLLVAALSLFAFSCGNDDSDQTTQQTVAPVQQTTPTMASAAPALSAADAELLSTFKSKDPFIQQNLPEETTTSTTTASTPPTTSGGAPTTTYRPGGATTTTRYYPPSSGGTTTTTKPPATTTTTAPHVHALKILSVSDVDGAAMVTFRVDNSVYKDKRVGDVVSSSWGQIRVVDLDPASKVATLLHGSETLVLSVGQVIYE